MAIIVADRCPLKMQNYDYINYLLTACFFEAWVSTATILLQNVVSIVSSCLPVTSENGAVGSGEADV